MSQFELTIKNVTTFMNKLTAALAKNVEDVNLAIEGTDDEFSTEILPAFRATLIKHLGIVEDSEDEDEEPPKKAAKGKKAPAKAKPAPKKPAAKGKKAPAKPATKAKPAPKGKKAPAKGKAKKAKDPNAPKRPTNAYIIYGQERRPEIKKEQPDLKLGEVTQVLAAEWNEMTDKEKKPYQAKAAKAKAVYVKAKAAYDKKSGAKGKAKKDEEQEVEDEVEDEGEVEEQEEEQAEDEEVEEDAGEDEE